MGQRRWAIGIVLVGAALLAGLASAGFVGGLRINFTPSYPIGLWRIEALNRSAAVGDLVFICPPPGPLFDLAMARGYLRGGLCPGGMGPLIKTVVAIAGQAVSISQSVSVDGVAVDHSVVLDVDAVGRPLPKAQSATVLWGHVFLHSDFAGSYDSRYFGSIPSSGILGLARPILTFAQ